MKRPAPNITGLIFSAACAMLFALHGEAAPIEPKLGVVEQLPVGGDGGWDYLTVDSARQHLFVTRGDNVQVIDTGTGKLLTTLHGFQGTHGVALADGVGFISNGKSNSVTVIDLNSVQTQDTIKINGNGPDAILYEPSQQRVFVINHRSGNVTVLDAKTHQIVSSIDVGPDLEFAATDGHGQVFVNIESSSELAVIDAQQAKLVARWKLGACAHPTGLTMDSKHHRLFSVCANNKMEVLNSSTGAIVAELPIGAHPDAAAFDPALGLAYASNGDGSLTVVHEDDADHFHVVENLPTQVGSRTMALDETSHRLYLAAAVFGPSPAASAATAHAHAPMLPGSFSILVVAPKALH